MTVQTRTQDLPRRPDAPGIARGYLVAWFGTLLGTDALYMAKLLASELVANAVVHGRGRIAMRASLDEERLLVEVSDEGPGFQPDPPRRGFEQMTGRGLTIVQAGAQRWGIREGSAAVWFELARAG